MIHVALSTDNLLKANPLQLPLAPARGMLAGAPQLCFDPASNRGRAKHAPPLSRGGWEGFEPVGKSRFVVVRTQHQRIESSLA